MKLRYWYSDPGAITCSQCIIDADDEESLARQIDERRREQETGKRDTKMQQAMMEALRRSFV